jgi:hypothetical protein
MIHVHDTERVREEARYAQLAPPDDVVQPVIGANCSLAHIDSRVHHYGYDDMVWSAGFGDYGFVFANGWGLMSPRIHGAGLGQHGQGTGYSSACYSYSSAINVIGRADGFGLHPDYVSREYPDAEVLE